MATINSCILTLFSARTNRRSSFYGSKRSRSKPLILESVCTWDVNTRRILKHTIALTLTDPHACDVLSGHPLFSMSSILMALALAIVLAIILNIDR
jgi:hypothetical protein